MQMHKLKEYQEIEKYKKSGIYPKVPQYEKIKGFYGRGEVMIISFCPNKNRDLTEQLKMHYFYLEKANLCDAHLTDFIKKRMYTKDANKYYKNYKKEDPDTVKEMNRYVEIIKCEIMEYKPKRILFMGWQVKELAKKHLIHFVEKKGIKYDFIPHFTNLRHENEIVGYKDVLKLSHDTIYKIKSEDRRLPP